MDVATKYAQPEVLSFWRQFGRQGLQAAESRMLALYAPPPARVLDLGCGAGRAGVALAPHGYRVTGLDVTWQMIRAAGDAYAAAGLMRNLLQGDARQIPLQSASFDVVLVLVAALQHIAGRRARQGAFADIGRTLQPGGKLILALDNVAPALTCYAWWGWRRLVRQRPDSESLPPTPHTSADNLLESGRGHTPAILWHARGLRRTLRWRTWTAVLDLLRRVHLVGGEPGDTRINQVSLRPTPGDVYYHIYEHDELVADAAAGGLTLLGYHSGRELAEGRAFAPRVRQLDKQVFYAFERES